MKYVLVIPDGAADEPQPLLGGLTPFQAAKTPHMDYAAGIGVVGQVDHVPSSMPSGSDVGTMSLFGYDPLRYHTGRAPIEAAAMGIELGVHDWAIRCNLVTTEAGRMKSFTAGQVPSSLGKVLLEALQQAVPDKDRWTYFPGISYRNILVYRGQAGVTLFSKETSSTPPHDITDQPISPYLPQGPGSAELQALMQASMELFKQIPENRERAEETGFSVSQTWLWGLGSRPAFQSFKERFGVQGGVITAVDLLRGMGRLIGWNVIEVPGATGYLDTDYAAKGRYAIEALKAGLDMVVVHVEASDEASHEGEVHKKVEALEQIDEKIVGPVHEYLQSQGEYRLLISPDHPTFLRTKTHSHGYVPFAMCGQGIAPLSRNQQYHEIDAKLGPTLDQGCMLMENFFNSKPF
jgi:2,3-bisphosphoglycerate-independent phosphoglycerate mutase